MRLVLTICMCVVYFVATAQQNLVPNSSFEEYFRCPASFSTDRRDFFLPGWSSPNKGTPDHYHQCSWGDNDVPFNWAGQSNAHSGMGYAGIYTWSNNGKNYREYIQVELQSPLTKGAKYRVEFYFKLSSYSVFATDRMGLIFSDSILFRNDDKLIKNNAVVQKTKSTPFTDEKWELATAEYTAKGNERAIIIGNFSDDRSTHHVKLDSRTGKSFMLSASAYYYIDDVSVVQTWPPIEVEESDSTITWSDGRKIEPNEIYILKNIQFSYDSFELLDISFAELDKLVSVMNDRPEWSVELAGHTDDRGSDDYNLELSHNRARQVGNYLVAHGIADGRIKIKGFGKQYPLINKVDEDARTVNRRVEVRFLK
ncbi:MAG TPA: OmpA family protein [Cyclobacteriaceae bacterium]|nr:OmpA family protein [Cyclobacteriaceae bacterium]